MANTKPKWKTKRTVSWGRYRVTDKILKSLKDIFGQQHVSDEFIAGFENAISTYQLTEEVELATPGEMRKTLEAVMKQSDKLHSILLKLTVDTQAVLTSHFHHFPPSKLNQLKTDLKALSRAACYTQREVVKPTGGRTQDGGMRQLIDDLAGVFRTHTDIKPTTKPDDAFGQCIRLAVAASGVKDVNEDSSLNLPKLLPEILSKSF